MKIIKEIFNKPILRGKVCAIKTPELSLTSSTISNSFSVTDSLHFNHLNNNNINEIFCITINRNSYAPYTYYIYIAGQPFDFKNLDEIDDFVKEHYPNVYQILKKRVLGVI